MGFLGRLPPDLYPTISL